VKRGVCMACVSMVCLAGAASAFAQSGPFLETAAEASPVRIGDTDTLWQVAHAAGGVQQDGRYGWVVSADRHRRNRVVNWSFGAQGFRRAGAWTVSGSAAFVDRPDFLFRRSLEGEVSRTLFGSVVLHGGYRHLEFPSTTVRILQPSLSWYLPRGEIQGRGFLVRNDGTGTRSSTILVRSSIDASPRVRLGGGAAIGDRIFDVATFADVEARSWIAFGSIRVAMTPQWHMELGIGGAHEDPLFSQRTLSLRLRRTF